KSRAMKSSTCGAAAIRRSDSSFAAGGFARAASSRSRRTASPCARKSRNAASTRASPSRSYKSLKRMPKPRCMAGRIIFEFRASPDELPYSRYPRGSFMQIKNSVFLVTGGASGLGGATARMAADNGAKVVIADLQIEAGEKLARELNGRFIKCDVASEADGKAAVALALKEFGGLH